MFTDTAIAESIFSFVHGVILKLKKKTMKAIIIYLKQDLSRRQANESKDTCPPQASPNSQALA